MMTATERLRDTLRGINGLCELAEIEALQLADAPPVEQLKEYEMEEYSQVARDVSYRIARLGDVLRPRTPREAMAQHIWLERYRKAAEKRERAFHDRRVELRDLFERVFGEKKT